MSKMWLHICCILCLFVRLDAGNPMHPFRLDRPLFSSGPIRYMEIDQTLDGLAQVRFQGRYYIFDPRAPSGIFSKVVRDPIPEDKRNFSHAKFRHGAFYCSKKQTIYRLDGLERKWVPVLTSKPYFSNFEILEDGRIALVCTWMLAKGVEVEATGWAPMLMPTRVMALDEGNMVEIYSPGAAKPEKSISYPQELLKLSAMTSGLMLVDETHQVGNRFLLIQSNLSTCWVFDPDKSDVRRVEHPWASWTLETALKFKKDLITGKIRPPSQLVVDCFDLARFVGFFPQGDHKVIVLARSPILPKNHYAERDRMLAAPWGDRSARLHEEMDSGDIQRSKPWKLGEINIETGAFREFPSQTSDFIAGYEGLFWLFDSGTAFPLKSMLDAVQIAAMKNTKKDAESHNTDQSVPPPMGGWDDPENEEKPVVLKREKEDKNFAIK